MMPLELGDPLAARAPTRQQHKGILLCSRSERGRRIDLEYAQISWKTARPIVRRLAAVATTSLSQTPESACDPRGCPLGTVHSCVGPCSGFRVRTGVNSVE